MEGALFDTHVHLDAPPLAAALASQLAQARAAGVEGWLVPGVRPDDWDRLTQVATTDAAIWIAPGCHPLAADRWQDGDDARLAALLRQPRALALGEIGLDDRIPIPAAVQEETFCRQVRLAQAADRPLLIHCRGRYGRLLTLLRQLGYRGGGILHSFGGSLEVAREALKMGFVLGIGGVVTWPMARRLPEVVRQVPAEALVLETDAPDLPPHPYRDRTNRPAWLPLVAARVAALRNWTLEETAAITTVNARRLLRLGENS